MVEAPEDTYIAERWRGQQRCSRIDGLPHRAARDVAKAGCVFGETGMVIAEHWRYSEFYKPDGSSGIQAEFRAGALRPRASW